MRVAIRIDIQKMVTAARNGLSDQKFIVNDVRFFPRVKSSDISGDY